MSTGTDRLRVHLFVLFDRKPLKECMELNLLGDVRGLRGRLKRPRVLAEFAQGDYAVVWLNTQPSKLVGLWRVVEVGENLIPGAFGGMYPLQVRVERETEHLSELSHATFISALETRPGKKEDFYDGKRAEALIALFAEVNQPGSVGPPPVRDINSTATGRTNQSLATNNSTQFGPEIYRPVFFDVMLRTTDWYVYEDFVHALLRALGIHKLYPIARSDQAGRSDGLFTIGNLAVIYDATLNANSEATKSQQIQNYIGDLQRGAINIPPNHVEPISPTATKRVWIIVRGQSGVIGSVGDVKVCHINVEQLMSLYVRRIAHSMQLEDLIDELARLGTT